MKGFSPCEDPLAAPLWPRETVCCLPDPLSVPNVWRGVRTRQQTQTRSSDGYLHAALASRYANSFVGIRRPIKTIVAAARVTSLRSPRHKQVPSRSRSPLRTDILFMWPPSPYLHSDALTRAILVGRLFLGWDNSDSFALLACGSQSLVQRNDVILDGTNEGPLRARSFLLLTAIESGGAAETQSFYIFSVGIVSELELTTC